MAIPNIPDRQPVHTVYGGAHLFMADTAQKLGRIALRSLEEYAPDGAALGAALGLDPAVAARLYPRIADKLRREAVEDYRIDFEDGFGNRPDEEEDRVADAAADETAKGLLAGTLPPGLGIRIKPLSPEIKELRQRSLRTFDRFLARLVERAHGALPPQFVVTLPKITTPDEVAALASACDAFEHSHGVTAGTVKIELMVETTQALVSPDGRFALPLLVAQGGGRVVGAHFGPYDYTAACHITAAQQDIRHPACDFARHLMLVSLAASGVRLSDGPTTIMPVAVHRVHRASPGAALSAVQRDDNTRAVHHAWRTHAGNVRHALVNGFYQGWDLHPAQLPSRYAAVYAFFMEGLDAASERLRHFVRQSAQATLVGGVFDDAATGQGLLNYFLRAVNCGAMSEADAVAHSGLTLDELRGRSFLTILANRRRS